MSGIVHLLHAIAVPTVLHIGGTAVPIKDAASVLSDIGTSIQKQESIPKTIERLAPDVIPIGMIASGVAVPYAGVAIAGVILILQYSKPPTPEDQQRMWDRAQGVQ